MNKKNQDLNIRPTLSKKKKAKRAFLLVKLQKKQRKRMLKSRKLLRKKLLDGKIFLPPTKTGDKKTKKILKKNLLSNKYKPKHHYVLKIVSLTLVLGIGGYFVSNTIRTNIYNSKPPVDDPHNRVEDLFDPNENDFDIDQNGQIVMDKMTDEEKQILSEKVGKFLLKDAHSRNKKVNSIKNILSVALLPYNLNSETNEFNHYCLSILFDGGDNLYALNYLAGKDFDSTAEYTSDFVSDFVNYLGFDCALRDCKAMSEDGKKVKSLFDDKTLFVGDAYLGRQESGDKYYFIPVYKANGEGEAFCSWASLIDAYEENPMTKFYDEYQSTSEKSFTPIQFTASENLKKILKIFNEQLTLQSEISSPEIEQTSMQK